MSRFEASGDGKAIAFGVDTTREPGAFHTFVQVWDTSEEDQPCNEGPGGFNNAIVDELDVLAESVIALAAEHDIPLDPIEVYRTFD